MMDWTDRHCRAFHRVLTRESLLYTEMVTTGAVLHGDRERLLGFDDVEHPVALQLGGSEPADLAAAARIGADLGYDEINLNVGCPSDRVQSGRFGACLMREPALVAEGMAAIRAAVSIPATVKCRIGVDDQEPEESLFTLVDLCAQAGVTTFIVHARKAWLKGLSPKENRAGRSRQTIRGTGDSAHRDRGRTVRSPLLRPTREAERTATVRAGHVFSANQASENHASKNCANDPRRRARGIGQRQGLARRPTK